MTPETFVTQIRKSVIADNLAIYKDLYESTPPESASDPYWVKSLNLYASLDEEQRAVLFEIMRQTMSDTISNLFGVIDGVSTLEDADEELKLLTADGNEEMSGDLQDLFLEQEEENA